MPVSLVPGHVVGPCQGSITFEKIGVHYYISGSFSSEGHSHTLQLWLDVVPTTVGAVCLYAAAPLFGHGAVSSEPSSNDVVCPVLLTIDEQTGLPLAETWEDCESSAPII